MVNKDGQFIDEETGEIIDEYHITTTEIVRNRILGLERQGNKAMSDYGFDQLRTRLLEIFDDNLTLYGEEYEEFLKQNEDEIAEKLQTIAKYNGSGYVKMSIANVAMLLNFGSPSPISDDDIEEWFWV